MSRENSNDLGIDLQALHGPEAVRATLRSVGVDDAKIETIIGRCRHLKLSPDAAIVYLLGEDVVDAYREVCG